MSGTTRPTIIEGKLLLDGKEIKSLPDDRVIAPEPLGDRGSIEPKSVERAITGEPQGTRVSISKSRPTFPCKCGRTLGPNDGRQVFKANVKETRGPSSLTTEPAFYGRHVYTFTCPDCGAGHVIESANRLTVAVPPVGEARNGPCPCLSGKKAKRCHPGGYVVG